MKKSTKKTLTIKVTDSKGKVGVTKTLQVDPSSEILHVVVGIDDIWEPSDQELEDVCQLFVTALEDPKGGVVATRTGVTAYVIGMK